MKQMVALFIGICVMAIGLTPTPSAQENPYKSLLPEGTFLRNTLFSVLQQGEPSTVVASSSDLSRSGVAEPHQLDPEVISPGRISKERIRELQEEFNNEQEANYRVPVGPPRNPGLIEPPTMAPAQIDERTEGDQGRVLAPNDMVAFRTKDISASEVPTNTRSNVHEPSVIRLGNTVFYTANWFAARSTDGGQNFTQVNPYTTFPSINGGFCCDQVTTYAPVQDMAIWGLQYVADSNSNTFRIARAIGGAGVASNSWIYYNFNPQMFGLPNGNWMDFPIMTTSSGFLYASSNVYGTVSGTPMGSVVWRISLSQLAAGGAINFSYLAQPTEQTPRLTEGAGTTMYWGSFANTTTMRIHRWDDSSNTAFSDDVALNSFTFMSGGGISNTADGRNWAGRADSRPLAAYVANGVIGIMWNAQQGGSFPQPYTIHARFNQSTRALITQQQIWNPTFAWLYPSVAVNLTGNLGGAIAFGGGTGAQVAAYPSAALWAIDDVSPTLPLGATYTAQTGNAGPADNKWGDYLSVHRDQAYPNTWVGAWFALVGGQNGSNVVPRYVWFGRERDGPVVSNGRKLFDFEGDSKADISVFRPTTGDWYRLNSSNGAFVGIHFGQNGDKSATADFDGDGKSDLAVFRPSNGGWYWINSSTGTVTSVGFGQNGDLPVPADYDGDGKADVCVFRPSNGAWYRLNSSNGQFAAVNFGLSTDKPAVADFDGDARADVSVFRPSTGTWYRLNSSNGQLVTVNFGANGDKAVPADYDGDGKADIATFRPAGGDWYRLNSGNGQFFPFHFGVNGDLPSPADFDGDGKTDIAVFRPSNGTWYLQRSTAGFASQSFGTNGDIPSPNSFVY